jgi:PIN domain nuclease of toxin-antitoxin system
MNYLLDTHVLIWFLNGDKALSNKARKAIEAENATNFISIASLWEIAIKISLNRLSIKVPFLPQLALRKPTLRRCCASGQQRYSAPVRCATNE